MMKNITIDFLHSRISNLCDNIEFNDNNINKLYTNIIPKCHDKMNINDLDNLIVNICDDMTSENLFFSYLGARILYENTNEKLREMNIKTFSEKVIYINKELKNFLDENYINFVIENAEYLDKLTEKFSYKLIEFLDLFGYKTLLGSYLIKVNGTIIEQPQDLFLRVATCIHYRTGNLENIKETFDLMTQGLFIHATPTLYNAGTRFEQLSSCYLLGTNDSLIDIYKTLGDTALISKWSGGIGLHVSNIRCFGSRIASTNGESLGIVPMLKLYNDTARYVNQGGKGNKRPGAIAVYLEPWHGDIFEFLDLKLNIGSEELRARDLFLALWIPDLFMKQVENDGDWYLMCPNTCTGLQDVYGEEFEELYMKYVREKKYIKKVRANQIWIKIALSQAETGNPYIMFKDNVNRKSNQKNIGTIKSSNLCAEITQVSDDKNYAVCNLASIAVNKFYNIDTKEYDYNKLYMVAKTITNNLNNIIDINYYPTPETEKSNMNTRPIGIGIQGIGNLLLEMRIPYETEQALEIESNIMETIYYGALEKSIELAREKGTYNCYEGSDFSKGILQFDNWDCKPKMWDFDKLKTEMKTWGTRNSLLTALMPTASTSQILGNMECFETLTSNLYTRKTSVGVFKIINKYLINDLIKLNLWNIEMKNKIIINNGSIQEIETIPQEIRNLYKTIWEIKQKWVIDHALARSPYIDQSQSMNLYFASADVLKIKSALFYGWKRGLKTGCYYLRSQPAAKPSNIIDKEKECTMCSS
jgi:ribonucleoside-diphosphate reductase subunit M1